MPLNDISPALTMTDPKLLERHPNGMIKKGSGGRVAGSRNKLSQAFLSDAIEAWHKHGKDALRIVFHEKPDVFLRVIASIIPRELIMTEGDVLDTLSDDDVLDALRAVREERARASYDS